MSLDSISSPEVIAAIIGAFGGGGTLTYLLKRRDEAKKKKEEAIDNANKEKEEAYRKLRLALGELSDRGGPVTLEMLKETDNKIQMWRFEQGNSKASAEIAKEHQELHLALDMTVAKYYQYYEKEPAYPVPKEEWQNIRQLRNALMEKLGGVSEYI